MRLLGRVEDFFEIAHHSVVIMRFLCEDGRIRVSEQIQLRTPDGQIMDTYVAGLPHVKYNLLAPRDPNIVDISLPPELTKQDVPPGTEIWSMRD